MHTLEIEDQSSKCGIKFCFITLLQGEESSRSKGHRKLDKWKAARTVEDKEAASGKKKQGQSKGKTAKAY